MSGFARRRFGDTRSAVDRVRAIRDFVWDHIDYDGQESPPDGDAVDTLLTGRGVCRDFAHLMVARCRAVDVPLRSTTTTSGSGSPELPWRDAEAGDLSEEVALFGRVG
jgi:transglutaminase-like putative cysteine protease